MNDLLDIVARNLVAILILFMFTIILGKKLVSQLNFFDFIAGITIGSIAAALCVDDTISYKHGITSLLVWGLTAMLVAKAGLKSIPARRLLDGIPTVLVQNGKILEDNLRKEKYHINDLLEELRLKGVFDISDLESAILETSGQISVQLKAGAQPITASDLHLTSRYRGLSANLIIDGRILHEHLRLLGRDENWLLNELKTRNVPSLQDVMLASIDTDGNLYIDLKADSLETMNVMK